MEEGYGFPLLGKKRKSLKNWTVIKQLGKHEFLKGKKGERRGVTTTTGHDAGRIQWGEEKAIWSGKDFLQRAKKKTGRCGCVRYQIEQWSFDGKSTARGGWEEKQGNILALKSVNGRLDIIESKDEGTGLPPLEKRGGKESTWDVPGRSFLSGTGKANHLVRSTRRAADASGVLEKKNGSTWVERIIP